MCTVSKCARMLETTFAACAFPSQREMDSSNLIGSRRRRQSLDGVMPNCMVGRWARLSFHLSQFDRILPNLGRQHIAGARHLFRPGRWSKSSLHCDLRLSPRCFVEFLLVARPPKSNSGHPIPTQWTAQSRNLAAEDLRYHCDALMFRVLA